MTPTTRKRLLIGGGGIVALLLAALVALPFLIDLNAYKPLIVSQVKTATGRDLVIDGPISLSLLPTPTVSVTGVKFFNAAGSKNANMVEVKSVTVKPSLLALLAGNIEVGEVTLVEPKIVLEINAEGKPNWEFAPSVAEAKPAAPKPSSPQAAVARPAHHRQRHADLQRFQGGPFRGRREGQLHAPRSARSTGPIRWRATPSINGAPLKLDLAVGARGANGHTVDLVAAGGRRQARLQGHAERTGRRRADLRHGLRRRPIAAPTFVGTLVKLAGQPEPALPPLLAGKFTFDGAVDVSQTAFAARDFKMALGQDSGSGSLAVTLKPKLARRGQARGRPSSTSTAGWLRSQQPAPPRRLRPRRRSAGERSRAPTSQQLRWRSHRQARLRGRRGDLQQEADPQHRARDRRQGRRRRRAEAHRHPAGRHGPAGAVDPDGRCRAAGRHRPVQPGRAEAARDPGLARGRPLVGAADKLQKLSLRGRMSSTGGNVQVSDAVFELDDLKGSGGVTVTFSVPLSIVTSVNIDTLDLDSFLVPVAAQQKPAAASGASAPPSGPAVGRPVGRPQGQGGQAHLQQGDDPGRRPRRGPAGQHAAAERREGRRTWAARRLAVRGTVANYSAPQPRPDIAFNFEAPDMEPRAEARRRQRRPISAPSAASGGVAGTLEQLTLRDLSVNAMGQSVKATGTLALPGASKGAPQSASYKGNLVLNGQALDGSIDARLTGRTTINADLRANVLDLDRIGGSGGGARPRDRPAAARPRRPSRSTRRRCAAWTAR